MIISGKVSTTKIRIDVYFNIIVYILVLLHTFCNYDVPLGVMTYFWLIQFHPNSLKNLEPGLFCLFSLKQHTHVLYLLETENA